MPTGAKPKPPGTAQNKKRKFEWQPAKEGGWTHGEVPPPDGLKAESLAAWRMWFGGWWAAMWVPEDVPLLLLAIKLFDDVQRGQLGAEKLTPYLDRLGLTPKGRQDLRWAPPAAAEPEPQPSASADELAAARRARLEKRRNDAKTAAPNGTG